MILDRTKAPSIKTVDQFSLKQADKAVFDNGLELYTVNAGSEEVVKIEWIFKAGSWFESKLLVAVAVSKLMMNGTKNHSSLAFAEKIDFFGATVRTACNDDTARITLYCLNKYLDQLLPLVKEMIETPNFPQEEIDIYQQNRVNRLRVNNTKNDYVAKNTLDGALFGSSHPYGYYPLESDYLAVNREDLIDFHQKYYVPNNCKVVASGKIPADFNKKMEQYFGSWTKIILPTHPNHDIRVNAERSVLKEMNSSFQAGLAIGKLSIGKSHPDYLGLIVANTIFGGYFGSRLMSNIREDKGFTYGIYSTIVPYHNASFNYIATEVGKDIYKDALKEIKIEADRLLNEKVGDSELDLVKNYILGNFLSSIDGPFALAERLKGLLYHDLDYDYYNRYVETVKNIQADELLSLYQKYFNYNDYTEVVAV